MERRGGEVRHPGEDARCAIRAGVVATRPARRGEFEESRRTVSGVAGVRVHRRGLFGVVDGDDGVDGPDEEVAALGLVELEAVDASRPLVREGLVPAQRRRVHAATRDARRERRGSRATELATAKLVARRVPTPGRRHAVRRERAPPLWARVAERQSSDEAERRGKKKIWTDVAAMMTTRRTRERSRRLRALRLTRGRALARARLPVSSSRRVFPLAREKTALRPSPRAISPRSSSASASAKRL